MQDASDGRRRSVAGPAANLGTARTLALAIAQTLVWAAMFYSFPALLAHWEAELGWTRSELYGALTLALLASAVTAPLAGSLIDRGYGRQLLRLGAIGGGLLLAALSAVHDMALFYALWLLMGACMGGCLYEPCFAWLIRTRGISARVAITRITLVAGLAGSLAFPLANVVAGEYGTQAALLLFSALVLLVAVPLLSFGTGGAQVPAARPQEPDGAIPDTACPSARKPSVFRRPAFWLLVATFGAIGFTHGAVIAHLLPMLGEAGVVPFTAVLAISLIGPMQVVGRIVMLVLERHVSVQVVAMVSTAGLVVAAALLPVAMASLLALALFVVLQGAGNGITSITRPLVTAELLGQQNFGVVSGFVAVGFTGAFALAPLATAAIWSMAGYDGVRWLLVLLMCGGSVSLIAALRTARR